MSKKRPKRNTPFQSFHALDFVLRIIKSITGARSTVVTVVCRFCEVFGKDEAVEERKRSRSDCVKYFKASFRKENFSLHIQRMHSSKWTGYCKLYSVAKNSFFDIGSSSGSQATMNVFAGPHTLPLRELIDKDIIDIIIVDMMFQPEDMVGITQARLLTRFVLTLDSSEDAAGEGNFSRYAIIVGNTNQFQLVAQYLAAGMYFRQMAQGMLNTKELLLIRSIVSLYERIVSRYARFICSMNLQCIMELLQKCWTFSVALDMVTHMETAYCDVCIRIRICNQTTVHDFHLLSIPIHDWHTGEIIFNTFAKAMDALYLDWRKMIIGASSDGKKNMTGRHQGVIMRIQRIAKTGFVRVWWGAHQLDLCMQLFYLSTPDMFYSTFTSMVAYLRRHQKFISDERSQCPLICDTRWINMIKVTTWFDKHWIAVVA